MRDSRPNIAVLAGYWSTNIGNAFFQLGAEWLLKQVLPDANVVLIGDQPGYFQTEKGNPTNALDYAALCKCDALVILGPFFRREMESLVTHAMVSQHKRGAKIIVLAGGMMKYDDATVKLGRDLLRRSPPFIFASRDTETYDLMKGEAEHAYDGIDVATFVSDLYKPLQLDMPDQMVVNFDQIPEPDFFPCETPGAVPGRPDKYTMRFEWEGKLWECRQPRLRTELSYRSRAYPFFEAMLPWRPGSPRPAKLNGYEIIRTDHRYNPFLPRKTYMWPNTYAGDVPHTYLGLYANSKCTLSCRVHACVATASFGNPAMLFTRSPRAYLLKRLGLDTIKDKPTRMDMAFLRREKARYISWLSEKLACFGAKARPVAAEAGAA